MNTLISRYNRLAHWFCGKDQVLGLLARMTFAMVLLRYFWNSALTKLDGGPISISVNAYAQIFPRRIEAAGYDQTALPFWTDIIVFSGTYAEFILPAMIVLGLLTRLSALGMIGFIALQTLTDLFGHGAISQPETIGAWLDSTPDSVIMDQRLLWLTLLVTLLIKGGGWLSLDHAFKNAPWVHQVAPQPDL